MFSQNNKNSNLYQSFSNNYSSNNIFLYYKIYNKLIIIITLFIAILIATNKAYSISKSIEKKLVLSYTDLVYKTYLTSYQDALNLQKSIKKLIKTPSKYHLNKAKQAWIVSRRSYGLSEAFRFYDGPIDFSDPITNVSGPESYINSWPVDESYIDYVKNMPTSGLINNTNFTLSSNNIYDSNQKHDEVQVSTGYHAIEFLLWGQDFYNDSPGRRSYTDYLPTTKTNIRRQQYLLYITNLLVKNLKFLVDSWEKDSKYYKKFVSDNPKKSIKKILTGLATLSGFELASERIATALDSSDQEDEHSCFSDNTHEDLLYNFLGVKNVLFYSQYQNSKNENISLIYAIKKHNKNLYKEITSNIKILEQDLKTLPKPFDSEILAKNKTHANRKKAEKIVNNLIKLSYQIIQAGKDVFDVKVHIASE